MKRAALVAIFLIGLPAGILVGAETAAAPANLSVVLEKAVYAEETAGDLDTASKLYRQVIDAAGANRPLAAQALQRLAMLQMKQGRPADAQATIARLKADYSDQKETIARAEDQLAKARAALPTDVVRKIVDSSVDLIATLNERDARLPHAVADLNGLPLKPTIQRLIERLDSDTPEQRQATLFLLWKAQLENIQDAVPKLTALLAHESDITRGMAAIALGGRKIEESYQALADMALKDSSSYARRCAVYALGELGDPRGLEIAQQALKDGDSFVQANAKATIAKLKGNSAKPLARLVPTATDKKAAENYKAAGWRHWFKQQYAEAEEQFKLAVEKDPTNADYWNGLGWAQMNQGKKQNARDAFERAVEIDLKAAASWNGLGYLADGAGQKEEAIKYWLKAIEASPTATASLAGLAKTYLEMKDYEKAQKYYQQWMTHEPESAEAREGFVKAKKAAAQLAIEKEIAKNAVPVAEKFAASLDNANYDQAWAQWSELTKSILPRAQFEAGISTARKPLGKTLSRKQIASQYLKQLPGMPDGDYVVIQFETEFEHKKAAIETITPMKDKDGVWRVSGYYIR